LWGEGERDSKHNGEKRIFGKGKRQGDTSNARDVECKSWTIENFVNRARRARTQARKHPGEVGKKLADRRNSSPYWCKGGQKRN